jgi:hypothetical protein
MAVAVVLDRASRLIVGHSACVATAALEGQVLAVQTAGPLASPTGKETTLTSPQLEVVIGYGPEEAVQELAAAARRAGAHVTEKGDRRCGSRMLSLIGHRLSRLRLRPRATNPRSTWAASTAGLSFAPMDTDRARALIGEAVREHNRSRLIGLAGTDEGIHGQLVDRYLERFVELTNAPEGVALLSQGCAVLRSVFNT